MKTYTAKEQQVIASIVDFAFKTINPESIYLFGSRARFEARDNSDYDFAFQFDQNKNAQWVRFALEAEEVVPTLLPIDLVNMNEISLAFKNKITHEGQLIYKRSE